jgi:hypothetical protein
MAFWRKSSREKKGSTIFLKSFTRPRVKLNWGLSDSRISSVQGLRRFFTPASSRVFSYFLRRFSRYHRTLTFKRAVTPWCKGCREGGGCRRGDISPPQNTRWIFISLLYTGRMGGFFFEFNNLFLLRTVDCSTRNQQVYVSYPACAARCAILRAGF